MSRFKFGQYGDGFPRDYPSTLKRAVRLSRRVGKRSLLGLRQMELELQDGSTILSPRGEATKIRRRAANKVARASRKRNR